MCGGTTAVEIPKSEPALLLLLLLEEVCWVHAAVDRSYIIISRETERERKVRAFEREQAAAFLANQGVLLLFFLSPKMHCSAFCLLYGT